MAKQEEGWSRRLNRIFNDTCPPQPDEHASRVRLPSAASVEFIGTNESVRMVLKSGATANMQTDASAFEGWALVLHRWFGVRVTLSWSPPPPGSTHTERCHYQRFLYRVAFFREMFGEWFDIEDVDALRDRATAPGSATRFLVNWPGLRVPDAPIDKREARRDRERQLELGLKDSAELRAYFDLGGAVIDRQFPVGLFGDRIGHHDRIFTGGKSAIDLFALTDTQLTLFELKAGNNISVGSLAELLFYVAFMRDVIRGRFKFADAPKPWSIESEALTRVTRIRAVLLGHKIHPLLCDKPLIDLLSSGLEKLNGNPSTTFEVARIARDEPYCFEQAALTRTKKRS
ncbi:MAG: hypothetical protein IT548_03145 [Alphaproteobacteria bacterium]|nr:hypothetical protein [Alphaproteobacteria bacterium]